MAITQDASLLTLNMYIKLKDEDWQPFPAYQDFSAKLLVKELCFSLLLIIGRLKQGVDVQGNEKSALTLMNSVENDGEVAKQLKSGEENLFKLGAIERIITLSNIYKEEFRNLSEQLNQPEDESEENSSEELCNLINNFITTKFN